LPQDKPDSISGMNEEFILHLPAFDGPLDLLLYLIERNRFTLEDLEVCPIIDQYLEYIRQIRSLDIALAGEFLEMSSYLIWLKSCLLLPTDDTDMEGQGESPVEELKQMLIVYRAMKQAAIDFNQRPLLYRDKFPRGSASDEKILALTSIASLMQAIDAIKSRTKRLVIQVKRNKVSIREVMGKIFKMLGEQERIALYDIAPSRQRSELVVAFMAALELSKRSIARIVQRGLFGRIYLVKRGDSDNGKQRST